MALLVGASAASAAAPRIVIFSGGPLEHQIVVSDWQAIFTVTQAVVAARAVAPAQAAHRPWLHVSMFWGPGWNDYVRQGKDPQALRPGQSDQTGRFYPAYHGRPPLLDLGWAGRWPRHVPPAALSALKRFGVPVAVG
ncbi:MAG: hypothetical protein QOF43_2187 [Gaiellaceae bacterium]|nr:hypothetical protein [Gaiellaceae bacterium]